MITGFSAATSSRAASATAPESPCGGAASVSFGMCSLVVRGDGIFLQLAVGHQHHRHRRRRHGDFVGAHGGFGEVRAARRGDRPTW